MQMFGRVVLQVLHQPINRILKDIHTIASTLLMVSEDAESSVRTNLLDQIPDIFVRCHELACPDLDYFLYDRLLEIVLRYLKDTDPQVRKNAYFAVTHLLEKYLLDKNRVENKVCPAVLELSNTTHVVQNLQIDYHTKAIELMGLLAPNIGQKKTQEFFLDKFIEMCSHDIYYVRKSCADYFPVICQVMGTQVTEKQLLPIFVKLCDDTIWGVRKSVAESLPKVALMCSLKFRRDHLAPLVFKLMNDSSRWVSMAAFKILGQFIASFAQPCITGLAYTTQGELFITNAADADFKHHSDLELLDNFQYYENLFQQSITPSSVPANRTNDNMYTAVAANENPYTKFLSPENVSNISANSPIQSMTKKLENLSFYYNNTSERLNNFHNLNKPSNINETVIEKTPINSDLSNDENEDTTPSSATNTTIISNRFSNNNTVELNDDNKNMNEINVDNVNPIVANDNNHLRKNTPVDLPSIIKLAIENKEYKRDHKKLFLKQNTINTIDVNVPPQKSPADDQPPNTPTVELTLQNLDFPTNAKIEPIVKERVTPPPKKDKRATSIKLKIDNELRRKNPINHMPLNSVYNTSSNMSNFEKAINAMQYDDVNSPNSNSKKNDGQHHILVDHGDYISAAKLLENRLDNSFAEVEDIILKDDEVLQEFNSANYWYISPALPLDLDQIDDVKKKSSFMRSSGDSFVNDLYKDDVRKLKIQELQALGVGPITSPTNFKQNIVPSYLVEYFVSMVNFDDPDLVLYCAYNFPAVVLTLGQDNWYLMHDLLLFLCGDIQWKIRKTVAVSIYHIALIIGRELATKDLVPIFLGFFKDLDEVKIEALRNLDNFLKVIDTTHHDKIVLTLGDCLKTDNDANWRFREELAQQVLLLIKTYGLIYNVDCMIYLTGIAIMLLTDKVSTVRDIALNAIVAKFSLSTISEIYHLISFLIKEFAKHDYWRRRQIFAKLCRRCIFHTAINPKIFDKEMLSHLIALSQDTVPNIRLTVAKCLNEMLIENSYFGRLTTTQYETFVQTLRLLQADNDRDVQYYAEYKVLPQTNSATDNFQNQNELSVDIFENTDSDENLNTNEKTTDSLNTNSNEDLNTKNVSQSSELNSDIPNRQPDCPT